MDGSEVFGYARVSTKEQRLDRQLKELRAYPLEEDHIFTDKASGKDFDRPGYRALVDALQPGDVVVIKSFDRLGRDFKETLDQWHFLTRDVGVSLVVLDDPVISPNDGLQELESLFISNLMLLLRSYFSQVERDAIKRRQAEGIKAARARGVRFGRPRFRVPDSFEEVFERFESGEITRTEAASQLKVSTGTFDAWRKMRKAQGPEDGRGDDSNNMPNLSRRM